MGSPIRVLHVVVNMNRGGAETLIMNLYRHIDRNIVQFDFLTCNHGVFDEEIIQLGGKVYRIPYVTEVGHLRYLKELDGFFTRHPGYQIIHSHMDKMSGFVLKAAKKAGIVTRIAHSHNTSSEGGIAACLYKWYAGKRILPNATHLLACSNKAAEWLFKGSSSRANILKNGIDYEKFLYSKGKRSEIRKELGFSDHHFVVGHIGRFNQQKNHSMLVEIFASLVKRNQNARLVLIGEGQLKKAIHQKVRQLSIEEEVIFLGSRSDVHDVIQSFDVFAFPSLHEGLPVTLVEAQAAGLPCLISNAITSEVDMGLNLVNYLPLKAEEWLQALAKQVVGTERVYDTAVALENKGYNIKRSALETQNLYLKSSR